MKIAICPKCNEANEQKYWGTGLLPFYLLNDGDELICPECSKPCKKEDLTLGFTGVIHERQVD